MKKKVADISVRIVPINELKPAPYNPRVDLTPEDQEYRNIRRSIEEYGYGEPILVNSRNMVVVSGHQRLKVLKEQGYTDVAVVLLSYDEAKERGANFAFNKAVGRWDFGKVAEGLRDLENLGYDLDLTFFTKEERTSILKGFQDNHRIKHDGTQGRPSYYKVDWDKVKVWHASVDTTFRIFPGFNYLISLAQEKASGSVERFPGPVPDSLCFVDSGLLTLARTQGRKAVERQGDVIEFAKKLQSDWVSMMDIPLIPPVLIPTELSVDKAREIHLENAKAFSKENLDMRKVFVVQGQTIDDYRRCAEDMRPYIRSEDVVASRDGCPSDVVAIGGVAKTASTDPDRMGKITRVVKEIYPSHELHIFGITNPNAFARAFEEGATSCDSSSANINLIHNQISYPKRTDNGIVIAKVDVNELSGFPLSCGGKYRSHLCGLNMVMAEIGLLAVGDALPKSKPVEIPEDWKDDE